MTSGLSVADKINADGNANRANGVPPKVIHRMLSVDHLELVARRLLERSARRSAMPPTGGPP